MTRTIAKPALRLGFFTRLLDQTDAAERYRLATEQIKHAERCGYDSAWIAQHHFHEGEGGLPSPFVFLSQAAVQTSRIRLGTGIVTLPLELPVRVAEDAVVTDLMCGGRLEVGIGRAATCRPMTPSVSTAPSARRCSNGIIAFWSTLGRGGRCPAATGSILPIPGWPIGYGRQRSTSKGHGVPVRREMG